MKRAPVPPHRPNILRAYVTRSPSPSPPPVGVARATQREAPELDPDTLRGRVLVALVTTCAELGAREVPEETVAVRAWELWPETFGLRGYAYPDARRVCPKLSATEVIVRDGYARRLEGGRMEPTARGWSWWDRAVSRAVQG